MIDSFLYLLARRVLSALVLRLRSKDYKGLEIILLRQEVAILRRQVHRPESRPVERAHPDRPHAGAGSSGQRVRRAMGGKRSAGVP